MLLEYTLAPDDYVAFNEHAATTSPAIRKQRAQVRAFGAVAPLVLGTLMVGVVAHDWIGGLVVGIFAAVVMWFCFPKLNGWLLARNLRKLVANGGAGPIGDVRLALGDTGITEEIAGATTSITWKGIDRITESDGHFYLFTVPLAEIIVPKRAAGSGAFIAAVLTEADAAHH